MSPDAIPVLAAPAPAGHASADGPPLAGTTVTLPEAVPLWRHVHRSSRELQRVPYEGEPLVVHNTEPAGSSFLVHDDAGQPHSRRGPAVTLHRPQDRLGDELLVVFCADLDG